MGQATLLFGFVCQVWTCIMARSIYYRYRKVAMFEAKGIEFYNKGEF